MKQLRSARGLTQAQLAGKEFTKGYVSLVETGRSRMSLRAAQIIASRLGVAVKDLLQADDDLSTELDLLKAESELSAGRAEVALKLARSVERQVPPGLRARWLRVRGRALTQSARTKEAIVALDGALRLFRGQGDKEMAARVLFDLALAHARIEELGEALNLALQCEHAMSAGDLVDRTLELQVLSFLASTLVTVGDVGAADVRAERAKSVAQDVADPRAVANLYESLVVTKESMGDLEGALAYARKGLAAYESMGQIAAIGSSWNTLGWVYIQRGQLKRAEEALDKAEAHAQANADGRLQAYVLQTQAELALARGNVAHALQRAQESIDHHEASGRCKALSLLVRAQAIARSKATAREVNAAFDAAVSALARHGRRQLARANQAHFEALTARGQLKEAGVAARKAMELMQPGAE